MTPKLRLLIILFFWTSCSKTSDKYFIGKQSKLLGFAGADYILAEKKGDSLQVWFITDDINAGYFERFDSETLAYKLGEGKHFSIKKITNDKIVGTQMSLHKVSDLQDYLRLRNEVAANKIESQFNDSIKDILQVKSESILFTHKICDQDKKSKLVSNTDCDTFPFKYRQYLQSNLQNVRLEAITKNKFYANIIDGKVLLDSIQFEKFINNYSNGFYDRQIFYQFIKRKPELFFLQINLSTVEPDVCYCPECFTKEELDEMYCKLKPLRQKNPSKLWMFERHGDLKCQNP
jgi:hypothetical protein